MSILQLQKCSRVFSVPRVSHMHVTDKYVYVSQGHDGDRERFTAYCKFVTARSDLPICPSAAMHELGTLTMHAKLGGAVSTSASAPSMSSFGAAHYRLGSA